MVPSGPTFAFVGSEAVVFNGHVYFAANDGAVGNELWRTNGTTTELVKDFNTGGPSDDGNPSGFRVAGNRLFFNVGNNDASPSEGALVVYYIDSSAPTTPVKTFLPGGAVVANGSLLGAVNGNILLRHLENGNGNYGLYALGGSGSTFADIDPGTDNVGTEPAATMGGFAYLTISPVGANGGAELYRTNGSTVSRVKDINTTTTAAGSSPFDFVATGNRVYFEANDGVNGTELWVTDGLEGGTKMVKDHTPGSGSTSILPDSVANGNTLFYIPGDPAYGAEPWRTDGTPGGTSLVKDITPGTTGAFGAAQLFALGSGFGMVRSSGVYTSDGTAAGTIEVAKAHSDGYGAGLLGVANSRGYFVGGFSPFGGALWRTDGTVAGTGALTAGEFTVAAPGYFGARLLTALGSKAIFFGHYPGGAGKRRIYVLETTQPDQVRQATAAPSISGTPAVGQQLTGNQGDWTLEPYNKYAFQWLRNGVPIPGAYSTVPAYKVVAADDGAQLSFRVTATGIGLPNEVVAVSPPVTVGAVSSPADPSTGTSAGSPTGSSAGPAKALALKVRTKPKLTGEARVGGRLKVTLPTFAQSGVRLTFQWFANGKRIQKQANPSLKLKEAHAGKRITLKVIATKAGHKTRELKAGPTQKVKRKRNRRS